MSKEYNLRESQKITEVKKIPVTSIIITDDNPRKNFPEESLRSLGESMLSHGQIDPIIVRPKGNYYELVVGERRWRAAQLVGMTELEAKIQDLNDATCSELRLIENTQREDLTDSEKGDAVYALMEKYPEKYPTIKDVAKAINKPTGTLCNNWCPKSKRLSPILINIVAQGKMGENHVTYLIKYPHEAQEKLAKAIVANREGPKEEQLTSEQWRKFFKLYDETPTADLTELIREAKGVEFVKIDTSKLTPKAKKEVEDILKERKKGIQKKRKESLAKAREAPRRRKPSKPKDKKQKPELPKVPEPTAPFRIEPEIESITVALSYPTPTFGRLTKFMTNKRMIMGDAIVYLTEKGLETEGIE